jgi:hypothetical protein
MQTFAKLVLAAGACALGLGAALPLQAADMAYPEAQAAPGYPAPPPGYYAPPPAQQGYYPPPPPPAAYGYPPPPPVEYDTYVTPPYVVAPGPYYGPGPYWRGYGPHYAYGYGRWRGYRRWWGARSARSKVFGDCWSVMAGTLCAKTTLRAWCPAMTRDEHLRIFAVRNWLLAEIAATALRGKKFQDQKTFRFPMLARLWRINSSIALDLHLHHD